MAFNHVILAYLVMTLSSVSEQAKTQLSNLSFYDNSAGRAGGGVYWNDADLSTAYMNPVGLP